MEFATPQERLVLIDLDGTILDINYQTTCDDFIDSVDAVQAEGWKVGLSSDSTYEMLQLWRERFGMNGPLIAERGAVVEGFDGTLHYDQIKSQQYQQSRAAMRDYFIDKGLIVWEGSPVETIRNRESVGEPKEHVVLINNERRCSLSVFLRRQGDNGVFELDNDFVDEHLQAIRKLYPPDENISEDLNYEYGLIIVTGVEVSKRRGTQHLQQLAGLGRIAMIGNSMPDYVGSDVAVHYAVQDATSEFKDAADYVAESPLTEGVSEVLKKLILGRGQIH